jgi:multiple sugar transport system permease protein
MATTLTEQPAPKPKRSEKQRRSESQLNQVGYGAWVPYVFSFPAIMAVSLVLAAPVLIGLYDSLFRAPELGLPEEWVGLQNFRDMFQDDDFWNSMYRTALFVGGSLIVGTTLGLFFAFALYRATGRLRFMRAITIAPYLISNVAAALMFRILFHSDLGVINSFLDRFGIDGPNWLADTTFAMPVVIFTQVWTDIPLTILLILGGLMTIDRAYLDAALVDGASAWQRARYVTIPLLAPQLVISTVWLSYSTLTGLGVVLALTGGGPLGATNTLAMQMYTVAFRALQFNEALALATWILLLNAVLTLLYVLVSRRYEVEL